MDRRPWARTDQSVRNDAIIDAALAATEVSHLSDRDIMTLSGGEQARVALSRVLAQQIIIINFKLFLHLMEIMKNKPLIPS